MSHSGTAWDLRDIPNLVGKRALVTGVTSGLGAITVTELAKAGADVILAARDPKRLDDMVSSVIAAAPRAKISPLVCDLADLTSVRTAAKEAAAFGPISILVNNAGVMATPYATTADGFELQFGTNHLGHFALTALLFEQLADSGDARVVSVSSIMANGAKRPPLGDPRVQRGRYNTWGAYCGSKLANLHFAFELDRRAKDAGAPITSVAAHPGYSSTNLQQNMAMGNAANRLVAQPAAMGALPSLMAATAPGLRGSTYIGPSGPFGLRGHPTVVKPPKQALNTTVSAKLWEVSEKATGVTFLS